MFGSTGILAGAQPPIDMPTLDVREIPPVDRHPTIHETFAAMDPGETLTIVNDHEPKPLYYEMAAEVPEFDADAYQVEQAGPAKFVAAFPKVDPMPSDVTTARLSELDGHPHATVFPGESPKTIRLTLPAGESVPPHDHPGHDVVFHLLEGEIDLRLDETTVAVEAGELVRFDGKREIEPTAREDSTAVIVLAESHPADSE